MSQSPLERLRERLREASHLESIASLLDWDQETKMPAKGVSTRAAQRALLAGIIHERKTNQEMQDLLAQLRASQSQLDDGDQAVVREFGRTMDRQVRVPRDLVEAIAELESRAVAAWANARKDNAYGSFAPLLEKMIGLKREVCDAVGYENERYDALLEEFEPGTCASELTPLLADLAKRLVPLVEQTADRKGTRDAPAKGRFDIPAQKQLGRQVLEGIGFDFDAGRIDQSTHPFCSGLHPTDVRLTTRYDESDLRTSLYGVIHEGGHGLYEQGLNAEHPGTAPSLWTSMGIHESQSRLWENIVGRGREFWMNFLPVATELFPSQLRGCTVDEMFRAVNVVERSPIRVEADEVTYNIHIALRYELEQALLAGDLSVKELPATWNDKMQEYLGLTPKNDAEGCLQDIHWSMGLFGYFPTYSLGNLYAGMLWKTAQSSIPDLFTHIASGDFEPLRSWLAEHIFRHGRRYSAGELVEDVTGKSLTADDFFAYLEGKFSELYDL